MEKRDGAKSLCVSQAEGHGGNTQEPTRGSRVPVKSYTENPVGAAKKIQAWNTKQKQLEK